MHTGEIKALNAGLFREGCQDLGEGFPLLLKE